MREWHLHKQAILHLAASEVAIATLLLANGFRDCSHRPWDGLNLRYGLPYNGLSSFEFD